MKNEILLFYVCMLAIILNMQIMILSISYLLKIFSFTFSTMILILIGLFWKIQGNGENKYARK
jgi:hypothetical protein